MNAGNDEALQAIWCHFGCCRCGCQWVPTERERALADAVLGRRRTPQVQHQPQRRSAGEPT